MSNPTPFQRDPVILARILVVMVNLLWIPLGIFIYGSDPYYFFFRIRDDEKRLIASMFILHLLPTYLVFKRHTMAFGVALSFMTAEIVLWCANMVRNHANETPLVLVFKVIFALLCCFAATMLTLAYRSISKDMKIESETHGFEPVMKPKKCR